MDFSKTTSPLLQFAEAPTVEGSWRSLGRPLGALDGLLGDLWGLQIDHKGVTRIESMRLGALDVFC